MIKQKVLTLLQQHREEIRGFKVKEMFVFGSLARDQITASSDIDILVKFTDPPTFDMYMDLKFFLEELLGRTIDLVTEAALRPELKDYIKKDLIRVA
ncbi:MAG: nucleotidyltransferase family protein [Chlamydiae bacterium]|nr:nucleotidyltransferase family protein [Chlamydiota bacterium]